MQTNPLSYVVSVCDTIYASDASGQCYKYATNESFTGWQIASSMARVVNCNHRTPSVWLWSRKLQITIIESSQDWTQFVIRKRIMYRTIIFRSICSRHLVRLFFYPDFFAFSRIAFLCWFILGGNLGRLSRFPQKSFITFDRRFKHFLFRNLGMSLLSGNRWDKVLPIFMNARFAFVNNLAVNLNE